jgi:signal transduction histidine kinase
MGVNCLNEEALQHITRARDDQRDDIAQEIHDLANTNIAALGPFGITSASQVRS